MLLLSGRAAGGAWKGKGAQPRYTTRCQHSRDRQLIATQVQHPTPPHQPTRYSTYSSSYQHHTPAATRAATPATTIGGGCCSYHSTSWTLVHHVSSTTCMHMTHATAHHRTPSPRLPPGGAGRLEQHASTAHRRCSALLGGSCCWLCTAAVAPGASPA